MASEQIRRRKIERHCAASIRALSHRPLAEYRGQRLYLEGKGMALHTPHLAVDVLSHSVARCRGVTDAIALRLRYSDEKQHHQSMPDHPVGRLIFDTLEQLRVESLVEPSMKGVKVNLDTAFNEWCQACRIERLIENELGLLIYGVVQIARSQLMGSIRDEEVEGLIESVRFKLTPVIGPELALLRKTRHDQAAYAALALAIARAVGEIATQVGGEASERSTRRTQHRFLMPPLHDPAEGQEDRATAGQGSKEPHDQGDPAYSIFCRKYDREVTGETLYRREQRTVLRQTLDKMVTAQAISIPRLAQRLQRVFSITHRAGWDEGKEEGYLDGRTLGQLVSNPSYQKIFKQEKRSPFSDTVISFLIDNSGSMKRQRFEAVTVLVDIYCRALELAGIKNEILGFTTGGWTGGRAIKAWRAAGSPDSPGRLNERLHIVYKSADVPWRRARYAISSLLNPLHYREGLDGEALQWASRRLGQRSESRKCLVMISDGAPMDSATSNYNDDHFLERHLKWVAKSIEHTTDIELRAIGIALDMEEFIDRAISVDLTGTLGNREFQTLERLFSPMRRDRRTRLH